MCDDWWLMTHSILIHEKKISRNLTRDSIQLFVFVPCVGDLYSVSFALNFRLIGLSSNCAKAWKISQQLSNTSKIAQVFKKLNSQTNGFRTAMFNVTLSAPFSTVARDLQKCLSFSKYQHKFHQHVCPKSNWTKNCWWPENAHRYLFARYTFINGMLRKLKFSISIFSHSDGSGFHLLNPQKFSWQKLKLRSQRQELIHQKKKTISFVHFWEWMKLVQFQLSNLQWENGWTRINWNAILDFDENLK